MRCYFVKTPLILRYLMMVVAILIFAPVANVEGQMDHMLCYPIKDQLRKLKVDVNIDTTQFGLHEECKIQKANLFCVPSDKMLVDPDISLLPVEGDVISQDYICYNVTCPGPDPYYDLRVTDQFASRIIEYKHKPPKKDPTLHRFRLCVPAVKGDPHCTNEDEICDDGIDNDCDEYVDCDDTDCVSAPSCASGTCGSPIFLDVFMSGHASDFNNTESASDNHSVGTNSCGNHDGAGSGAPDIVYRFPSHGGPFVIRFTAFPEFEGVVYVVEDCTDIDSSCVGFARATGDTEPAQLYFPDGFLKADTYYYIIIDGSSSGDSGQYWISIANEELNE